MNPQRQLILLGTGTSVGVPMIGCDCEVCTSSDSRNQRYRCGVAVTVPQGSFLIDTPPELRLQLLREKIKLIEAVVFTHSHADHVFGLDDLRIFSMYRNQATGLYCEEIVERQIRKSFDYAFIDPHPNAHRGATPQLQFHRIGLDPFELMGVLIQPIRLLHGKLSVLGFRVNDVAYCTDVSEIPDESWALLQGLDVLVIDALRDKPHPTHFNIEQSLGVVERVQPGQTYFTHIAHSLDHTKTNARLPKSVELAYDGLRIPF